MLTGKNMKLLFVVALIIMFTSITDAQNWPSFRGQNGSGIGDGNNPPTAWDTEKSIHLVEDSDPRSWSLQPNHLGRPHLSYDCG
jgi:hypothetical protein